MSLDFQFSACRGNKPIAGRRETKDRWTPNTILYLHTGSCLSSLSLLSLQLETKKIVVHTCLICFYNYFFLFGWQMGARTQSACGHAIACFIFDCDHIGMTFLLLLCVWICAQFVRSHISFVSICSVHAWLVSTWNYKKNCHGRHANR